jgi:hypothetical protein
VVALAVTLAGGCSGGNGTCGDGTRLLKDGETVQVSVTESSDGSIGGFSVNGGIYGFASTTPPNRPGSSRTARKGVVTNDHGALVLALDSGRRVSLQPVVCD